MSLSADTDSIELESLDPQKRELLEARIMGRVGAMYCGFRV